LGLFVGRGGEELAEDHFEGTGPARPGTRTDQNAYLSIKDDISAAGRREGATITFPAPHRKAAILIPLKTFNIYH
jgi:hypothetical protein